MIGWEIIDLDGFLAISLPPMANWTLPQVDQDIKVSDYPVEDYAHFVGCHIEDWVHQANGHEVGRAWCGAINRSVYVDTHNWRDVSTHKPVRPPRKVGYAWSSGRWRKV